MRLLAVLLMLPVLLPSASFGQDDPFCYTIDNGDSLACSTPVTNKVGDLISGTTTYSGSNCQRSDGGQNEMKFWDLGNFPEPRAVTSGLTDFQFRAGIENDWVWFTWSEGSVVSSDWTCQINVLVNGRTVLDSSIKEAARQAQTAARQIGDWFSLGMVPACLWNKAACATLGLGVAAMKITQSNLQRTIDDPFDPDFWYPYDPVWLNAEDLGLTWQTYDDDPFGDGVLADYGNALVWNMIVGDGVSLALWVSGNRANSCDQEGADCGDWQAGRARSFTNWFGWILGDMSDYLTVLGNEFKNYNDVWFWDGQTQQWHTVSETFYAASQMASDAAWNFQQ